jgi:putative salt-induced outer membrane protein YdiY
MIRARTLCFALTPATLALAGAVNFSTAADAPAGAPAPAPDPAWETTASAGATVTRGNSKTLLFTAGLLSQKKWQMNEARLGVDGAYGKNDSVKNTEFGRLFGQYNRLFTDRWFGYVRAELSHDAVADVEYRLAVSPGAGYYFLKDQKQSLSLEVGPGFITEKLGNHQKNNYFTLRVAERYELKLNDKTRVWQSAEWLPQVDHFKNYLLNSEIGLETQLTKKLSFRTYIQDTYDNEPTPGRKKNDLKLVSGIAYKF